LAERFKDFVTGDVFIHLPDVKDRRWCSSEYLNVMMGCLAYQISFGLPTQTV